LLEHTRRLLEQCDSVQGVTIASQGHGIYAGLTTLLLEEFQQECRTAGRFVWNLVEPDNIEYQNSWQPAHVQRVRKRMETGLALFDWGQASDLVLPLSSSSSSSSSQSEVLDSIATSLEAATLPYRSHKARIGLAGGHYGGSGISRAGYSTSGQLSFGEFLASLRPASQYKFLSLSHHSNTNQQNEIDLLRGTSIEKIQQQRDRTTRQRDVTAGDWIQNSMTSLSPFSSSSSLSSHEFFSMATSMRPAQSSSQQAAQNDQLTCLIESMYFGYRPQTSIGLVANLSFSQLTQGGYAAGSYWQGRRVRSQQQKQRPVLSLLANSTNSYNYLGDAAKGFKESLSRKFMGYHNRDVMNGILPEAEDCEEALEYCLGIRDTYCPPDGGEDEEGIYFDDGLM